MGNYHNLIQSVLEEHEFQLSQVQIDGLNLYANHLLKRNQEINLTAIVEPEEMVRKHFLDCLYLVRALVSSQDKALKIIDVGSGAGFPGMVLALFLPQAQLTFLDSLNKRIVFLKEVADLLALSDRCSFVHGRAEDVAHTSEHRNYYDVVVARAVAPLDKLAELCIPFAKVGGVFVAMKGPNAATEIDRANKAFTILKSQLVTVTPYQLGEDERNLVRIKIKQPTPKAYPRKPKEIEKKTLGQ